MCVLWVPEIKYVCMYVGYQERAKCRSKELVRIVAVFVGVKSVEVEGRRHVVICNITNTRTPLAE